MKLIVGLGNPGKEYDHTRHNMGWDAVTELAKNLKASDFSKKATFKSEVAEASFDGEKILLIRPLTFMNLSGEAVQAFKSYFKINDSDILIVQDEMDFPVGKFAFSTNSSPGGHNGIASIQTSLGTKAIARLRIGINIPFASITRENYVLSRFTKAEQTTFKKVSPLLTEAMIDWITLGLTKTMNVWNGVNSDLS